MILRWKGTFDQWLALPPAEVVFTNLGKPSAQTPLTARILERLADEFRWASREYTLHHRLLVRRDSTVPWSDVGPPEPSDPRLHPRAFEVWAARCAAPLADGTVDLQGRFELTRGESSGCERFRSLALQVVRALAGLAHDSRQLPEGELLAAWMIDLYRSARLGLPGLCAQPRVRHSGRLWSAARLDETAQSPGVVGSFAVRTDGGVESRCWYADLEPECFSASALKLEAILAGLAAVDGPRDRAEVWRPSGWYRDAVPSLGTETLRKARLRGAELSARMSGNQWEYEVGSVIRHWPQYAALVQEALRAEEPAT
jgi:hypothetical protein